MDNICKLNDIVNFTDLNIRISYELFYLLLKKFVKYFCFSDKCDHIFESTQLHFFFWWAYGISHTLWYVVMDIKCSNWRRVMRGSMFKLTQLQRNFVNKHKQEKWKKRSISITRIFIIYSEIGHIKISLASRPPKIKLFCCTCYSFESN